MDARRACIHSVEICDRNGMSTTATWVKAQLPCKFRGTVTLPVSDPERPWGSTSSPTCDGPGLPAKVTAIPCTIMHAMLWIQAACLPLLF